MMTESDRLADFITLHLDALIEDWEGFARVVQPEPKAMSQKSLRNWARKMLKAIAADMAIEQTGDEQTAKSKGERPESSPELTEVARVHALQRLSHSFDLNQLMAEFRALRASVVRRWTHSLETVDRASLEELVRFNEALDQALTESLGGYAATLERARTLMIGAMAHDLRNAASAIAAADDVLLLGAERLDDDQVRVAVVIRNSITRLRRLIADLIDFARTRLGNVLGLTPEPTDLAELCQRVHDELAAQYPDRHLRCQLDEELTGTWDPARLEQLLSNLLANALRYGDPQEPVTLAVRAEGDGIRIEVRNGGPPIPAEVQPTLFDPLMRSGAAKRDKRAEGEGVGLGLYIARQIALAHGGDISVRSNPSDATTFTVQLPRHAA